MYMNMNMARAQQHVDCTSAMLVAQKNSMMQKASQEFTVDQQMFELSMDNKFLFTSQQTDGWVTTAAPALGRSAIEIV